MAAQSRDFLSPVVGWTLFISELFFLLCLVRRMWSVCPVRGRVEVGDVYASRATSRRFSSWRDVRYVCRRINPPSPLLSPAPRTDAVAFLVYVLALKQACRSLTLS